ncbi:MAG TPA: hypothetical protein VGR48_17800, partial [Terriglobales bacterium]|nr:hypothetical protein [Terriglobales bacterium]
MGKQVKKEPHGVGGWLALFCFALLMAGLFSLGGALVAFKEKTEGGTIGGYIGIALVIFTMAVLTALCLHRRMAVKLAYTYLAVQALFWLLAALLGESVKYFAGALAVCTAWALYFHRSQRVR